MTTYPNSVIRRAEQILGYGITSKSGPRTYPVIDGTVYADVFTGEATIEDYTGTIRTSFNGRSNGMEYYNQLYLGSHCHLTEVTLDLDWGSSCFMTDIDGLLAWLNTNSPTDNLENAGVSSKKIEDFSVSFRTASDASQDVSIILNEGYGFYIRRPLIIEVAKEQRYDHRHF